MGDAVDGGGDGGDMDRAGWAHTELGVVWVVCVGGVSWCPYLIGLGSIVNVYLRKFTEILVIWFAIYQVRNCNQTQTNKRLLRNAS